MITIIVLLILAGVSIAMLTGENGILTQAQKAETNTNKMSVIEQTKLDILAKQTEENGVTIYKEDIKGILDKYFESVPDDFVLDTELQTKSKYGDYIIKVSEIYDGELKNKPIKASELNDEEKKKLYGKYVINYKCSNNDAIETDAPGKWMIFYIGDSNIYLIASDYINTDYCPKKNNKTVTKDSEYLKGASFVDVYSQYTGGSVDVSKIGRDLNKSYFIDNPSFVSNYFNMQSAAYMLDTTIWSGFVGDDAEYAIGGPTVELLFESYNKKYSLEDKYQARAKNITGYEISTDAGNNWATYMSNNVDYLRTDDPTYVINSTENAAGMWLASPSAYDGNGVMGVYSSGDVSFNAFYGSHGGFRPLVFLKSDVQLEKNDDGSYTIK